MRILILILFLTSSCIAEDVVITNRCSHTVFVRSEGINTGPINLPSGDARTVTVDRNAQPRPRLWGHRGCDGNGNNCDTTEGYVSLAEFHIDSSGWLWYDVSQVDGYNLPITMEAVNPGAGGNCRSASCSFNIDSSCPQDNKVFNNQRVVACRNPDRNVVTDYSRAIKAACPGVYSYAFDNEDVMRDCLEGNNGLRITFC